MRQQPPTLIVFEEDPIYRRDPNDLRFSLMYAFSENFILPLSQDELAFGKGSRYRKMAGGGQSITSSVAAVPDTE